MLSLIVFECIFKLTAFARQQALLNSPLRQLRLGILKILGRIRQIKVLQSLLVRTFGYGNFFHAISKKCTLM
ncbi:hypothetical protein THOG05_40183 [Vibrio rotiferianus]|nr:hypothetical protein THOG05_40183 [Vibrio rotiferianus]